MKSPPLPGGHFTIIPHFLYVAPKSAITCGTAASNPTTSSMPASFGSAMLNPFDAIPTTTSLAGIPVRSRYCAERLGRMDAAGPGLVVRVDHEQVDRPLVLQRPEHRQRAVGSAELADR